MYRLYSTIQNIFPALDNCYQYRQLYGKADIDKLMKRVYSNKCKYLAISINKTKQATAPVDRPQDVGDVSAKWRHALLPDIWFACGRELHLPVEQSHVL